MGRSNEKKLPVKKTLVLFSTDPFLSGWAFGISKLFPRAVVWRRHGICFSEFSDPPSEYRPAPFWVWNELMTIEKIERQLQDLKDKGFGGAFVHARPGLIAPYLSEEWLFLFKEAVKLGRELGLKIWVYDENSYPSGFAGGLVPAAFPEVACSGLRGKKLNKPDLSQVSDLACVLQEEGGRFVDLTERVKAGEKGWPEGQYWVFEVVSQEPYPRVNPDNMALNAYAHMPGIDILMNEWSLQPQAQFGNSRAVRELRSRANQLGRRRTLSETYGASS